MISSICNVHYGYKYKHDIKHNFIYQSCDNQTIDLLNLTFTNPQILLSESKSKTYGLILENQNYFCCYVDTGHVLFNENSNLLVAESGEYYDKACLCQVDLNDIFNNITAKDCLISALDEQNKNLFSKNKTNVINTITVPTSSLIPEIDNITDMTDNKIIQIIEETVLPIFGIFIVFVLIVITNFFINFYKNIKNNTNIQTYYNQNNSSSV